MEKVQIMSSSRILFVALWYKKLKGKHKAEVAYKMFKFVAEELNRGV